MNCDVCQAPKQPMIPCAHRAPPAPVVNPEPVKAAAPIVFDKATSPLGEGATSTLAQTQGVGPDWAQTVYGNYYARSVPVYAAVKLRAEAITRPPMVVYQVDSNGDKEAVPDNHPYQQLLRRANPFWTRGDLWRGTSTYLDLWGSCFWALAKAGPTAKPTEIWPVRPDQMKIVSSKTEYISHFRWESATHGLPKNLRVDEVVWFRHFNPLSELSGLSPIAPLRLSLDTSMDAGTYNRNAFKNELQFSNVAITSKDDLDQEDMEEFYEALDARFASPKKARRPLVMANGMEAKNLGFSPRDMEHINSLRWSLEDVSRAFNVPKILLGDLERATYSNVDAAERIFWRGIAYYLAFLQEEVNEMLTPQFGENLVAEFDLSVIEALQPDIMAQWKQFNENVRAGTMTINEARDTMGLEPAAWGDTPWFPLSMVPVSDSSGPPEAPPAGEASYHGGAHRFAPTAAEMAPNGHKRWHPPTLTDAYLDKLGEAHIKRADRLESVYKTMQRGLFKRQEKAVLHKLRQNRSDDGAITRQGEALFDPKAWASAFSKAGLPLHTEIFKQAAEAQIDAFGLGVSFDVNAPQAQAWLRDRTAFWADRVNAETARLITSEVTVAVADGASIREIETRLKDKVFGFNIGPRTERIARTEVQNNVSRGALEAYEQSGVVERVMWLATLDDRVREDHADAHRQVVALGAPFLVGGEQVDFPGDGSAGNAINCRCTTIPVIGEGRSLGRLPVLTSNA